jgi:vacuolar-type H+-ATPase subunit I/STV1
LSGIFNRYQGEKEITMDENRRSKFESLLTETREEIGRIEEQIQEELAAVKERLAGLQNEKKAQLTIYGGYCQLLGVPNDLEDDEDEDEA